MSMLGSSKSSRNALALNAALALLGAAGCSSAPPAAAPPTNAESTEPEPEAAEPEPAPPPPACQDESCLSCGDGMCPSGAYCDASSAEPSCAWLPSCAGQPSCACLLRTLGSACTCEDGAVGPTVRCN